MDIAYSHALAETEIINVDYKTLGDVGIIGADFELLHGEAEFTAGFHTSCMTFEFDGNLEYDGLFGEYLEKVDVEDIIGNGVELDVFYDSHTFFAVYVEFDSENIGSVDEFANGFVGYSEVGGDETFAIAEFNYFLTFLKSAGERKLYGSAAIENYGNTIGCTECFCGFFTESSAGLCDELKYFHCTVNFLFCVTKNQDASQFPITRGC